MKALAAIMIAALSALATTGITSAPLLDVERTGIVSIVGVTTSTKPPVIPQPGARPVEVVVDTTVVDTTVASGG